MYQKRGAFIALLMSLILLLGACTGPSAESGKKDQAGEGSGQQNTASEEKEPMTLTFIDCVPSPERETFFLKMIDIYQKENPHITLEYGSVPYEESTNKLTQLGAAGDLPDIINMQGSTGTTLTEAQWLLPLDQYIEKEGYNDVFVSAITDVMWAGSIEGYGAVYTIPDGIMTNGIFIRKDWAQEAGLDLDALMENWTWETYIDTVYKLTDPEKGRYGISYRGGGSSAFDRLEQYLVAYTGSYDFDNEGNCLYYTPENVDRMQKFLNMYIDGCAPKDSINWGFAEMVDNFTGGLTATLNNDVEVVATCMERMDESQWTVLPLPRSSVDNRINSYVGPAYSYAIPTTTEHPDEAWGFIEVLCRAENNAEFCKTFTNMPIRNDIQDEFFSEEGPVAGFIKQLNDPDFCSAPSYGGYPDLSEFRAESHVLWQKVLMGSMTCDEALRQVDEQLTAVGKKWLADNPGKSLSRAYINGKFVDYDGPSGEN